MAVALKWHHNGRDSVSNHQPHDCLLSRLSRRRSKKTSKLRVTGLCEGNSPGTGEFSAQKASNSENVFIWWRHHDGYSHGSRKPTINFDWGKHNFYLRLTNCKVPAKRTINKVYHLWWSNREQSICSLSMVHIQPTNDASLRKITIWKVNWHRNYMMKTYGIWLHQNQT